MNSFNKFWFGLLSFLVSCGDPVDDSSIIPETNPSESNPDKIVTTNRNVVRSHQPLPDPETLEHDCSSETREIPVTQPPQPPESFTREELRARNGLTVELQGDAEFLIVGDVKVPWVWFCNTSDHVRNEIVSWSFKIFRIDGKNTVGVVDEEGHFVTWPGAQSYPDGKFPPGYTFFDFDAGVQSSKSGLDVSF